jgi:hypothetical protein
MSIEITEQPDSRAGNATAGYRSKQTRHWWIRGSNSIDAIYTALHSDASCPLTVTCPVNKISLIRSDTRYKPQRGKQGGCDFWDVTVDWEDPQAVDDKAQLDVGDYKFSVSTTGGTARITTSLKTVMAYNALGSASNPLDAALNAIPWFEQAIGVTRDGDVQGVDIVVPACKFSIEYRQPKAVITAGYVRTVEVLTGTCNNAIFFGRAAGEVLFMGGDGSQGIKSDPTWRYDFVRMPNLSGQRIGDILNVAKRGHDYLWVLFEETLDPAAKYVTKRPKAVYVEQVYQSTGFSALGIGT